MKQDGSLVVAVSGEVAAVWWDLEIVDGSYSEVLLGSTSGSLETAGPGVSRGFEAVLECNARLGKRRTYCIRVIRSWPTGDDSVL